jgi:hypothetical protein
VTFERGQAVLSPLRFYYDSADFKLPVRLGLLSSQGTQDLIVSILAPDRYEVANHPNVTIPTNIRVQNEVRDSFGSFYEALFAKTVDKAEKQAVVTEYAWNANSCDPCPTPALDPSELATLGADVTLGVGPDKPYLSKDYVLTRLHYRYTKDSLGDDLVFKSAPPLVGGRGVPDAKGNLEDTSASQSSYNNFQGRYVILHPWEKTNTCQTPVRGRWGGPEGSPSPLMSQGLSNTALIGAPPTAGDLPALLAESVKQIDVVATHPLDPLVAATAAAGGAGGSKAASGGSGGVMGGTVNRGGSGGNAGSTRAADSGVADASDKADETTSDSGCSCSVPGAQGGSAPRGALGFGIALALGVARRVRRRV